MTWDLPTTPDTRPRDEGGVLTVVVILDDRVFTQRAPEKGELRIGRAETCHLRIDDSSVSREHAVLRFARGAVHLEDLGSHNGTRVRGRKLEPGRIEEISAHDVVEIGLATLLLQKKRAAGPSRRLWSHTYFELRLSEAAERGKGAAFAVVRVSVARGAPPPAVQAALTEGLGPADVVASYAPGEYELLLEDPARVEAVIEAIQDRLEAASVPHRTGVGRFPEDGTTPDELLAKASTRLRRAEKGPESEIVIASPAMQNLYKVVDRVARGTISVLLLGETGVGKEVVAAEVHRRSPRASGPYVKINCAALSPTLMESELFGYEKGAFTGADAAKKGLLEAADQGTIFLDEIGEMPLETQAKLLRVLEQKQVLRVGAVAPRSIDVRFVAATNRDLEAEAKKGTFRSDLYYRLNGISLQIPPLRERKEELPAMFELFVQRIAEQVGVPSAPELSPAARARLLEYSFPGNVRELRNILERAVLLATGDLIEPEHLPLDKLSPSWEQPPGRSREVPLDDDDDSPDERARIVRALEECGGNQTRAAELLGYSRRTLTKKLTKYDLPRPLKGRR